MSKREDQKIQKLLKQVAGKQKPQKQDRASQYDDTLRLRPTEQTDEDNGRESHGVHESAATAPTQIPHHEPRAGESAPPLAWLPHPPSLACAAHF